MSTDYLIRESPWKLKQYIFKEKHMPFGTKVHSFSHSLQKTEWELIENSGSYEHLKIVTRAECWNSKNAWRWECQHSRKRGGERVKSKILWDWTNIKIEDDTWPQKKKRKKKDYA